MKRTKSMLCAAALSCLAAIGLLSCSNGLLKDPRLYNGSNKQAAPEVAPEPELGFVEGINAFDEIDKWYNNPDSNGDEREPGKEGFPASEFDAIQITGWFSGQNVPTYTMTKKDVWSSGDQAKREFVHAGAPDTEGQGWAINGVKYYQYRGINPGYAADGNYNQTLQVTANDNPQLKRFYFYRFTGKGGGIQALDNYLIAVDTYSKLVFAFSEPVAFSTMGAPTKWDPTDNEPLHGVPYQFYMYDPVGYVLKKDDGSYEVTLYQWFQDSLAKGNYKANIQGFGTVAEKRADGQGSSPFNNQKVDFFKSNLKLLAGKTFTYREKMANGGYGLKLHTFTISADGTTLTRKTSVWNNLEETPADVVYTIGEGENATKGAVSGGDGKVGWLEIKDGHTLVLGTGGTASETATTSFQDPGPQFLERVKDNPTYKSKDGSDTYEFKAGSPNKLIMDGEEYTYAGTADHTNRSIYERNGWFYGVELTSHDFTVKMTVRSGYHAIQWYTLGWAAQRDEEMKDNFCDNVLNHSFMFRPKDDTGDGLYLYTWEFSDNGKKVSLKKKPWNKAEETIGTWTVSDGGQDGLKGTANGATFTLSEDKATITVSGCSDSNGNGTFSQSEEDPGPSFLNRVKGATYKRGNTSYQFSEDGKTLTYTIELSWYDSLNPWGPKANDTFKYDEGSDEDNVIATYGGGYRVHLTENDTIIKMASVNGAGDGSDMRWPADRQP